MQHILTSLFLLPEQELFAGIISSPKTSRNCLYIKSRNSVFEFKTKVKNLEIVDYGCLICR